MRIMMVAPPLETVFCEGCDMEFWPGDNYAENAISAWNTRATVPAEPEEVVAWALILTDDTGERCADVVKGIELALHWRDEEIGSFAARVWKGARTRHEVRTIRPLTYAAQEDSNRGD